MYEALAQRYHTTPWAVASAPAADVLRHLWLMTFTRDPDAPEGQLTEDQEMRLRIADRAVIGGE